MVQQWNQVHPTLDRPALPPPRLTSDIYETAGGEAFVLEIPVPGLSAAEVTIEATSGAVTVSTRRREEESNSGRRYIQREQPVQPMSRLFEFPVEIDTDNIRATLEHGILRVFVPKAPAGRRRVIKIWQAA